MTWAVISFHNEARTDYLIRGPFKDYEQAVRAENAVRRTYGNLRDVNIVQMVNVSVAA